MFFRKKDYQVPDEYMGLYLSEQNAFNLRHLYNVTLIMIPIIIVLLVQHAVFPEKKYDGFQQAYHIIYSFIVLEGAVFLLATRFFRIRVSEISRKFLILLYLYILSFLLMGLTFYDLHSGQELSAYIIVLMFLSTMTWFNIKEFALISTFVLLLLILSYLVLNPYHSLQIPQFVQAFVYYSLSWILFLSISTVRIENLLNRITMEQQYEMLETESACDPLTGLYNRRHLKDELQKELARSSRSEIVFCIMLIDIDHFKRINDNYGHMSGDEVLKELSALLRNSVRISDKVFRYGGEEFILLLPETLKSEAMILGNRIRDKVENYSFSGIRKKITISGGIAQSSVDSSADLLIQKADKRLYSAKRSGRNRVLCEDTPRQ